MLAIRLWGMRHCGFDPQEEGAVTMTHRRTGTVVDADWTVPKRDAPFSFSQLDTRINPGWAAERAARAEAFADDKRIQVSKRSRHGDARAASTGATRKRKPAAV